MRTGSHTGPGDWLRRKKRGLTRLRRHWVQGRVSHFRLETGQLKSFRFFMLPESCQQTLGFRAWSTRPRSLQGRRTADEGGTRSGRAAVRGIRYRAGDRGRVIEDANSPDQGLGNLGVSARGSRIRDYAQCRGKSREACYDPTRAPGRRDRGRTRKERTHRSAHLEIPKFGAFPLSQIFEFQARPPRSSLFSANFLTSPPSGSVRGSCYSAVRIYVVRSVGEKADIREG